MSSTILLNNGTGTPLYICSKSDGSGKCTQADASLPSTSPYFSTVLSDYPNPLFICSGIYNEDAIAQVQKNPDGTVTVSYLQVITNQQSPLHIIITNSTQYDFAINVSSFTFDITKTPTRYEVVALKINENINNLTITYLSKEADNQVKYPFLGGVIGENCTVTYSRQAGDFIRSLSGTCYVYLGDDYSNTTSLNDSFPYAPTFPLIFSNDLNSSTCFGIINGGNAENPFVAGSCPNNYTADSCTVLTSGTWNPDPIFDESLPTATITNC